MNHKKLFLFVLLLISFFAIGSKVEAGTTPIKGWGWSSNIGWISFNCINTNDCATSDYKVNIATSSGQGVFTGYAWSPNIGWISFNDNDFSHQNVVTNLSTGAVTGWARATAGIGRTDGWDGWISMSGTNYETGPAYITGNRGITFDPATGIFKGYAWGDTNVGWLTFDSDIGVPGNEVTCAPNCGGGNGSNLNLEVNANGTGWYSSASVTANSSNNATVIVRWDIENVSNVHIVNNTDGVIGWPGANTNDTDYNGVQFSTDNQTSITFSNITSTVVKKLRLMYTDNTDTDRYAQVTITINPYVVPPVSNCSVPANAKLCQYSVDAQGVPSTIVGSCTSTILDPVSCEFYCPVGFVKVGNICKRPGVIEEI